MAGLSTPGVACLIGMRNFTLSCHPGKAQHRAGAANGGSRWIVLAIVSDEDFASRIQPAAHPITSPGGRGKPWRHSGARQAAQHLRVETSDPCRPGPDPGPEQRLPRGPGSRPGRRSQDQSRLQFYDGLAACAIMDLLLRSPHAKTSSRGARTRASRRICS